MPVRTVHTAFMITAHDHFERSVTNLTIFELIQIQIQAYVHYAILPQLRNHAVKLWIRLEIPIAKAGLVFHHFHFS